MKNELLEHMSLLINNGVEDRLLSLPQDYFNWGRDKRHVLDNTEKLPVTPRKKFKRFKKKIVRQIKSTIKNDVKNIDKKYASFNNSYLLMSDDFSRDLFAELLVMQILGENKFRLRNFNSEFVDLYEKSSKKISESEYRLKVYNRVLKKICLNNPKFSIFTQPIFLTLHESNRLYSYYRNKVSIDVFEGDTILEGGVGWGDTSVYFAAKTTNSGKVYSFDILDESMNALNEQLSINPQLNNVTPVLMALSDVDGATVHISNPSPAASVRQKKTGRTVETISIDNYVDANNIGSVEFIKMDIEGSEVPALKGAKKTLQRHKPKLAISVYHKWDDLREIPKLIDNIRGDYEFYIDCTTGFGGEAVLYCR